MSLQEVMNKLRYRFQTLWSQRSSEINPPLEVFSPDEAYRKGYMVGYWEGVGDGVEATVVEGVIEVGNNSNLCV